MTESMEISNTVSFPTIFNSSSLGFDLVDKPQSPHTQKKSFDANSLVKGKNAISTEIVNNIRASNNER